MTNPSTGSADITTSMGDYLKALWTLSRGEPVSNGDLAGHLDVTAPSVTGMLAKLKKLELIEYERYRGARLTEKGRAEALRLLRRHRLLETFLIDHLGYSWDEVHEEAEAMEHVMSDRFTERLAERLGQPTHDPHGDPIPGTNGTMPSTPDLPLAEVEVGRTFLISRLGTQDADLLGYFHELGLRPGREVTLTGREPQGNLLSFEIGGQRESLSRELALLVLGEAAERHGRT